MRVHTLDDFAVELQHETQHAMRGRVLGTEVQMVVAEFLFGHRISPPPFRRPAADIQRLPMGS